MVNKTGVQSFEDIVEQPPETVLHIMQMLMHAIHMNFPLPQFLSHSN